MRRARDAVQQCHQKNLCPPADASLFRASCAGFSLVTSSTCGGASVSASADASATGSSAFWSCIAFMVCEESVCVASSRSADRSEIQRAKRKGEKWTQQTCANSRTHGHGWLGTVLLMMIDTKTSADHHSRTTGRSQHETLAQAPSSTVCVRDKVAKTRTVLYGR